MKSMLIAATAMTMALPLAACADNRLVEGAAVGAAVGAGVGAVTDDVSVGEGAGAGKGGSRARAHERGRAQRGRRCRPCARPRLPG